MLTRIRLDSRTHRNRPRRSPSVAVTAMLLSLSPFAFADRIQLTDGRVIEGSIVKRTQDPGAPELVHIELSQGIIALPAEQVATVSEATPRERALLEARDKLRVDRPVEAVAAMDRYVQLGGMPDGLAPLLIDNGSAIALSVDAMDAPHRDALRRALDALDRGELGASPDLAHARLWLRLALGDTPQAGALMDRLVPLYYDGRVDQRRALAGWLNGRIDACADKGDNAEGERLLDALGRVDPALAVGRRVQFYMQWARRERDAGRFEEALILYRDRLMPAAPRIAAEFIRRTLEEADRSLGERSGRVVELYERYGLPAVREAASERLVQIHRNDGWRALRRGDYDDARTSFEKANAVIPACADKDLLQLEFHRRRAAIDDADLLARYELGVWCNNRQLDEEALAEFRAAVDSRIVGDNARTYIDQVMNRRAERELAHIMDLYDQRRFREVLDGVFKFQRETYAEGYQQQARRINDLTMKALQISLAERPQQAEALYQQAERAFYQDRYQEADEKLRTIGDHYRDTLVYPQARNLHARVSEKMALSRLEQGDKLPAMIVDTPTTNTPGAASMGDEIGDLYRSLERAHAREP
jgi:tetratricopeptide (TPR) repeat protein